MSKKQMCKMAWFLWMEIIYCTNLFLDTLLTVQVIATSVLFLFQTAEDRNLEDVSIWCDPGHSNGILVSLGPPLRIKILNFGICDGNTNYLLNCLCKHK